MLFTFSFKHFAVTKLTYVTRAKDSQTLTHNYANEWISFEMLTLSSYYIRMFIIEKLSWLLQFSFTLSKSL